MKLIMTLLKRYLLTLLTLVLILCLTFWKPTDLKRTDTIVELDKVVHFLMYATLCIVFWYENFKVDINVRMRWMLLFAVVVPIAIGGLLEYLQNVMTNYRTGDFDDFVFNSIGVVFAALFSVFVTRPVMRKRSKDKHLE